MNLVTIQNNVPVTTTLAIAEGVGYGHKTVIQLVKGYREDFQELGTLAFQMRKSGGRPTEYAILNERQSTLLLSYMKNSEVIREFKKRLVKRFYEMADKLNQPQLPSTYKEALLQLVKEVEQREVLEHKLEEQRPQVEYMERYVKADNSKALREVAKILGIPERTFTRELRERKIAYQQGGSLLPYQPLVDKGYFLVRTGANNNHCWHQTRVTPKGLQWLSRQFISYEVMDYESCLN